MNTRGPRSRASYFYLDNLAGMSPCVKKCLWVHEKVHGKQCEAWKMSPGAGQSGNWYEMEGYCAELMCLNGHIRRAGGWQLRIPQCANYLGQY